MNEGLVNMCRMFLTPASILFAALGVASTDPLKTLISVMGLLLSGVWFYSINSFSGAPTNQRKASLALAAIFVVASLISVGVHAGRWFFGWFGALA